MSDLIVSADPFENAFVPKVSRDGGQTFTHLKTHVDDIVKAHEKGKAHLTEVIMNGHISGWKPLTTLTGSAALIAGVVSMPGLSAMLAVVCAVCFYKKLSADYARRQGIINSIVVT